MADVSSVSAWISISRLLRPQGRRGEILAELLTDQLAIFSEGRSLLQGTEQAPQEVWGAVTVENCWQPQGRNAGRLVLKLAGVDSISEAETLEGRFLWVLRDEMPALEQDTFFVRELLDCALYDGSRLVGVVQDLQFPTGTDGRTRLPDAADLLVVHPAHADATADPVLVPFVKAWLDEVDLPGKRIVMHLPEGLFESTTPTPDGSSCS